jgi:hypothetical protein
MTRKGMPDLWAFIKTIMEIACLLHAPKRKSQSLSAFIAFDLTIIIKSDP